MSQPPPRPSPLAPGFKLDRYELLCPIAEGGMASVWIARQTGKHGFEKLVAIKTILAKYASDARFQQMFLDEARIASRIEHTNVAQILDVGEQHDTTFLVMEYVDGDSLSTVHRVLQKKNMLLPAALVLRIMGEVCGGLHAAHELRNETGALLGVVHRDVSPQNVLVSTKGIAKLIDFGIAKARDRVAGDTNTETLKGKVRYMAPEQAHGHAVDRRADVWAVGAILYHLLTGKPPFDGENDMQTLLMLTSGRPPPPLPRSVHPAVASVVLRALTSRPEGRFETTAEMQQAIHDAAVTTRASSSANAVASFLVDHVGDAARKRKEAIALGTKAAADREKYAEAMRSNVRTTGAISSTGVSEPGPPKSGATGGTLGSAALDVGGGGRSRRQLVAIGGAVAVIGVAIAGTVLATRSPASTSAGKPPPSTSAIRPGPSTAAGASTSGSADGTDPLRMTVAATDLPPAVPPPSTTASAPPPRPGARPPPPQGRPGRPRRVDDGF